MLIDVDVSVKFDDSSSNSSGNIRQRSSRRRHFRLFLNSDNYQPEVVSDVISGTVVHDVSADVGDNFGDSR